MWFYMARHGARGTAKLFAALLVIGTVFWLCLEAVSGVKDVWAWLT